MGISKESLNDLKEKVKKIIAYIRDLKNTHTEMINEKDKKESQQSFKQE